MKNSISGIPNLGDPGAVSGGGEKSNRGRKIQVKNETFLRPTFLTRLNFSLPPLTASRSPWMGGPKPLQD